ncbi:hypothetical protein [Bacillus sp. FJAT-50079]|uniref:hypothetical protein n=1 Tax=Bacillus sp. FJAT-50079 TaxID=2833577 RepID=UPI001BC8DE69|nr:hypothetical protein [Bacillus sp. FJAT-50079]MBS4209837.1 hypothetical protein [Bacillus sp. FJAT-50079]
MKWNKIIGWLFLVLAVGLFCLQIGYLLVSSQFQVEYIDNRLFYIVNILCIISFLAAVLFLFGMSKKGTIISASIVLVFVIVQATLLYNSNGKIKNITSISPDYKHVLGLKENIPRGETVYYRSYYGILARPKEALPFRATGEFKVQWLAKDVAAVTYKTTDGLIQQFIATYGNRGGASYYNVGPEIQGIWEGEGVTVDSDTEGIAVTVKGQSEQFTWDHVYQYGTLAIVLKRDQEAVWTIALGENIKIHSHSAIPIGGNILLYKATMDDNDAITLEYKGRYD